MELLKEEIQTESKNIPELFQELVLAEPKLISDFVPEKEHAKEQKDAFLRGDIRNPKHIYNRLDDADFEGNRQAIHRIDQQIARHRELDPKIAPVYRDFAADYLKKTRLMEVAHELNHATDENEKQVLKAEYRQLNVELYGEPDKTIYKALLAKEIATINAKDLDGRAAEIRDELLALVPDLDDTPIEVYEPSEETKEWVKSFVQDLYEDMLGHVVKSKESYTAVDLQWLFNEIIADEFTSDGEDGALFKVAEGWTVDIEPATVITVKASEKRIVIPDNDKIYDREDVLSLVGHELGVHFVRALSGGETNVDPHAVGAAGYYDSEEALATIFGQAAKGKFEPIGAKPYILSGLAFHEGKDFRDLFEIKWRLAALGEDKPLTDEKVAELRSTAYNSTLRIERGTNENLPWLKDTGYRNGAEPMWRYLESIHGDNLHDNLPLMFLITGGRINAPDPAHQRNVLESRSLPIDRNPLKKAVQIVDERTIAAISK